MALNGHNEFLKNKEEDVNLREGHVMGGSWGSWKGKIDSIISQKNKNNKINFKKDRQNLKWIISKWGQFLISEDRSLIQFGNLATFWNIVIWISEI